MVVQPLHRVVLQCEQGLPSGVQALRPHLVAEDAGAVHVHPAHAGGGAAVAAQQDRAHGAMRFV